MASAYWVLLLCSVAIFSSATADWNLIVTHSNDILYHLDQLHDDYSECSPEIVTTTAATTTVSNTTIATSPSTMPTAGTNETTTSTTTVAPSTTNSSVTTTTTAVVTTTTSATTTSTISATTVTTTGTETISTTASSASPETTTTQTTLTSPSTKSTNSSASATTNPVTASSATSTPSTSSSSSSKSAEQSAAVKSRIDGVKCYGGVARHSALISQLKTQAISSSNALLNLNAGGMLGGSIWLPLLGPNPAAETAKSLQYSAMGLGYQDFDEGVSTAAAYLKALKNNSVTVVCANMDVTEEPSLKDLVFPSVIVEPKAGLKVGIIGFIGKDADFLADTGKLRFKDECESIKQEAEKLKNEHGVNFIIALGSAGYELGKQILEKTSVIDILVNGGSNTFLYNGDYSSEVDVAVGSYPYQTSSRGKLRVLVQLPRFGKYLGVLNVTIGNNGQIQSVSDQSNPILLDNTPDAVLENQVKQWATEVSSISSKKLGTTLVSLESGKDICWKRECNAATLMTNAALWYLNLNRTSWTSSVSAVVWHGGALSDSETEIHPGDVTFGDVVKIFPYANTLAVAEMEGSDVKKLFEVAMNNYNEPGNIGEFLHVAGCRVELNLKKPKGSRVVRILIRSPKAENADLYPLEDGVIYKIGMPSFIARGQMKFGFMESIQHIDTGVRDETVLEQYISFLSVLTVGNDDRVLFVDPPECWVDQTGTVFLTIFLTLLTLAVIYLLYKIVYPRVMRRRNSQSPLVRMGDLQGF